MWSNISTNLCSVAIECGMQERKLLFQKRSDLSEVCIYMAVFAFYLKM